jgi:hypothetical protein
LTVVDTVVVSIKRSGVKVIFDAVIIVVVIAIVTYTIVVGVKRLRAIIREAIGIITNAIAIRICGF